MTCYYCGEITAVNDDGYCEMCMDVTACPRCGMQKSRRARLCRECDSVARGWPYHDETGDTS